MTTQELEKIHGPLVGRTGKYRPPPYGGSIGVAIICVDHHSQQLVLRPEYGGADVNIDVDAFWKNFSCDPIISTPTPQNSRFQNVVFSPAGNLQTRAGLESLDLLPAKKVIPEHTCSENMKHYDSGWSAYNYCSICDKKET